MPSIQARSAFGSGSRSLGPPTPARSSHRPPELSLDRTRNTGTGTWGTQSSEHKWGAASGAGSDRSCHRGAPSAAPSGAPAGAPSGAPACAPAPSSAEPGPGSDWRDAFRTVGRAAPVEPSGSKFRTAVEAERWRSKLSGASNPPKKEDKLDAYNQPAQASWARERLLGTPARAADTSEEEEMEVRTQRVVGQAWVSSASAWVEVQAIDRLEAMLRRRLGELESASVHAGRAARSLLVECDPSRSGRVLLSHFVESMGRKLNYDFPTRGSVAGSRHVLRALFERYDLDRSGVIGADDFHAALMGSSREGRASGRVVNAIGRLREGIVRSAGGYDALRVEDARWYAAQKEAGHPSGYLPAGIFVDGLVSLAELANIRLSDADLNVIVEAFEPPPEAVHGARHIDGQPWCSFDEFTLAVRGPPMSSARVGFVRAAYAALKDDASKKDVKPHRLAERYSVASHPAVEGGELSDEHAAMAFLYPWRALSAMLDEEVTLKEFADRYEWISPLYEDDEAFERMMRAAWRLR